MLFKNSRWRFASERNPEREARLLCIANPNDPANPNPNQPQATPESQDELDSMNTEQMLREFLRTQRNQTQNVLQKEKTPDTGNYLAEDPDKPEAQPVENQLTDEARELLTTAQNLHALLDDSETTSIVNQLPESKEFKQNWISDKENLEDLIFSVQEDVSFAEAVSMLKSGWHPDEFMNFLQHYNSVQGRGFDGYFNAITDVVKAVRNVYADDIENWELLSQEKQQEIGEQILKAGATQQMMSQMLQTHAKELAVVKEQAKYYETMHAQLLMDHKIDVSIKKMQSNKLSQIRFYSLMDLYQGGKDYWEALKNTWDHQRQNRAADVSNAIGTMMEWVPLVGHETKLQLNQNLRNKNKENTKKEIERLEGKNWKDLFGSDGKGGLLKDYLRHGNNDYARAVVEYAAGRGWLYDVDDTIASDIKLVFGYSLDEICRDWDERERADYYNILRSKNALGRDTEMSNNKKDIADVENVPLFIKKIKMELDAYNIWAVAGICERAMERGLEGEVAPWLATTILNKLDVDPVLRSMCNEYFFDKIGKMSMYNTAFTLGWFKQNRKNLSRWGKIKLDGYFRGTEIGKSMVQLEEDVIAMSGKSAQYYKMGEGQDEMSRMVARILAGQTLEVTPGRYISIYETKYKWYRDAAAKTFSSPAKPFDEDSDYYTGESEQLLNPENVFKRILANKSTGDFEREDLAAPFLEKILKKAIELKNLGLTDAYKNFVFETRAKLNLWVGGLKANPASERMAATVLSDKTTPAIAKLYTNHLISHEAMEISPLWKTVKEQIKNNTVFPPGETNVHYLTTNRPSTSGSASSTPSQVTAA